MSRLEEPIDTLERRGISLRLLAVDHATPEGLLPRYRVILGADEHWFENKSDLDAFFASEQQKAGRELKVADETLVGTSSEVTPEEPDAAEGLTRPSTLHVTDLHEVRSINHILRQLESDFGLTLNDLIPLPPRYAEAVYPYDYEIAGQDNPRRLTSLRELLPTIRDIGSRGLTYTRFKGLGEMNPNELFETAMDPETRVLKQVTLHDAAAAEEIFRVLMGDHVEPRREFIEKHALDVKDLDI